VTDQIHHAWPGWRVMRHIGTGSFGQVYEISRDIFGSLERSALKVIPLPADKSEVEKLRSQGYGWEDIAQYFRRCREDIAREYSLMAEVKGHPNIVYCDDFRDVPRPDGIGWDIYIKMELLQSLFHVMPNYYSEALVVQLGKSIASALALCEKKGILHRDIKPENIFYAPSGEFKLGDFGVAKLSQRIGFGTTIGTFDYMAPEVYGNRPYGPSADLYSLGLLMYWAMNDRRIPFLPEDGIPTTEQKELAWKQRMEGTPLPLPRHGSPELVSIVMNACAHDPRDRYPSAAHLLQALQRLKASPFMPAPESHFRPAPSSLEYL